MSNLPPSSGAEPLQSHDERRAVAAWSLLHLIRVFTNLFFFQGLSIARSDTVKPSLDVDDQAHRPERFLSLPLAAARSRFRALTGAASRREDR